MATESTTKVLSVIPGDSGGASMIFVRRLMDDVAGRGFNCQAFYLQSRTSLPGIYKEAQRLRKFIAAFEPDLIHAHYGTVTSFVSVLCAPCPVVVHLRGSDVLALKNTPRTLLARLFTQFSVLKARRVICVSEHLKSALWWRKDIAVVIPSGVDLNEFQPGDRNEARAGLGWDLQQPIVVFNASRDPSIKRLSLAKASMELVKKRLPEARLIVLDGHCDPHEIPRIFQGADCLLLASKYEGSPNVVKEALACDLPVVSVDVGDVKERLQGVKLSSIVAADAASLAKALTTVLESGGTRSNGRLRIAHLGLPEITKLVIAEYERALS